MLLDLQPEHYNIQYLILHTVNLFRQESEGGEGLETGAGGLVLSGREEEKKWKSNSN